MAGVAAEVGTEHLRNKTLRDLIRHRVWYPLSEFDCSSLEEIYFEVHIN
jgi:hypothetical protein